MKQLLSKLGTHLGILPTTGGYHTFHREDKNNTHLLILVHGFTGDYTGTWGRFPDIIVDDSNLTHYDVLLWGYPSSLLKKSPNIQRIGARLKTELDHLPDRYQHIVMVGHSMGGLGVRATVVSALLNGKRVDLTKIKHILLFGTPNEGIDKADLIPTDVKKQIDDMKTTSDFIIDLRNQWLSRVYRADTLIDNYHLSIPTTAVAGLEDNFVPPQSVASFFEDCETTDGDHRGIVKPNNESHASFKILRKRMLEAAPHYEAIPNELNKEANVTQPVTPEIIRSDTIESNLSDSPNNVKQSDENFSNTGNSFSGGLMRGGKGNTYNQTTNITADNVKNRQIIIAICLVTLVVLLSWFTFTQIDFSKSHSPDQSVTNITQIQSGDKGIQIGENLEKIIINNQESEETQGNPAADTKQ